MIGAWFILFTGNGGSGSAGIPVETLMFNSTVAAISCALAVFVAGTAASIYNINRT